MESSYRNHCLKEHGRTWNGDILNVHYLKDVANAIDIMLRDTLDYIEINLGEDDEQKGKVPEILEQTKEKFKKYKESLFNEDTMKLDALVDEVLKMHPFMTGLLSERSL